MYHKNSKFANGTFDFNVVNHAARPLLLPILQRLLPGGKVLAGEYTVRNPKRADRHLGSFRINIRSGKWADFAVDARGGDPVSLIAYIEGCSQSKAACLLAQMIGLKGGARD